MTVAARVLITFDADDELDAEATVESWQLSEGAQVTLNVDAVRTGTAGVDGTVDVALPLPPPPPPDLPPTARTLTLCDPSSGPTAGGTLVTLAGTGLTGIGGVKFGNNWALENEPVDDMTYRCKTPNGSGTVDVTVIDGDRGGATLEGGFTYE